MHKTYKIWPQVLAAMSVCTSGVCTGTFFAFSSVAIPLMQRPEGEGGLDLSLEQGSWIVSLFFLGTILGSTVAGPINHRFGTKVVAISSASVIIIQWAFVAYFVSVPVIMVGRIVSGACYGTFLVIVKVYNAEVTHPDLRGATSSLYTTFLSFGFCFGLGLGYFLKDLQLICVCMAIPAVVFLTLSLFIPNSPYWLVERGRDEAAQESLQWLRGQSSDISDEFTEILAKKVKKDLDSQGQSLRNKLQSRELWRPLAKVGSLLVLIEMGGMNVTSQYLVIIFRDSGTSIDPFLGPLIVGASRFGLGLGSTLIHRYCPRRPLILTSCLLTSASFIILGLFNYISKQDGTDSFILSLQWVPLFGMIIIQVCDTIGFLVVINLNLQPESFPTQFRSIGCGLCGVITAMARFVMSKLFAQMLTHLQFYGLFAFFGSMFVIIGMYCHRVVPENMGQCLIRTEEKMVK